MARLRTAPSSQPAGATRVALKEKTNTTRASMTVYENDGNTEGLVKDAKPRRGRPRRKVQQDSEELMMAGAIGASEEPTPVVSDIPTTTDELAKSDAAPLPTAKGNRRPPRTVRKVAQNEAQTKVIQGLKQRMAATAQVQRAKIMTAPAPAPSDEIVSSSGSLPARKPAARKSQDAVIERSEFSLSPSLSPPPPGKLSAVKGKRSSTNPPGSVLRIHSTPAVETSMLALKNFKRRPRQPSMLAMVQQRTASARPSAVYNATAVDDSSIYDLQLDDDEDDFAPEAEGTPMDEAKKKRKSSASLRTSAKRRKSVAESTRDDTQDDTFATAPELNVNVTMSSERAETPQPAVTSDAQRLNAPSSSTPPTEPSSTNGHHDLQNDEVVVPSTERELTVELDIPEEGVDDGVVDVPNGTMAEPASSSPVPQEPLSPQYIADMADPATQVSPAPVRSKPKKQKAVSTATLQAMLPKRRKPLKPRQRKSEYDMESESEAEEDVVLDVSHLENDEDELGGEVRRLAPSRARKSTTAKKSRAGKVTAAAPARQSTAARSRKASAVPPISKAGVRTYGRGATSDKENDEQYESVEETEESILPDVSASLHDVIQAKELEEAKRRFAEVDDWDMEFESMSQEDHRDSSQTWR